MVEVVDEIELSTKKVRQAPRTGTVIAVRERLVTVRWPTGEQSTLVPSPGTLSVVRLRNVQERKDQAVAEVSRVQDGVDSREDDRDESSEGQARIRWHAKEEVDGKKRSR